MPLEERIRAEIAAAVRAERVRLAAILRSHTGGTRPLVYVLGEVADALELEE